MPSYSMPSSSLAGMVLWWALFVPMESVPTTGVVFFSVPMVTVFPTGVDLVGVFFPPNVWVAFLPIGSAEFARESCSWRGCWG